MKFCLSTDIHKNPVEFQGQTKVKVTGLYFLILYHC